MKITESKDLVKVNQILPIMQEHFGNSMNLTRIKLMAFMLHALCVVQTVIALVWVYLVDEHKDINVKPIRILKHGRKAKSLVKYGLEEISNTLFRPTCVPKFDVFKFLSCTLKKYS